MGTGIIPKNEMAKINGAYNMTELKNKVSKGLNLSCGCRLQKYYVESVVYFATFATCSS